MGNRKVIIQDSGSKFFEALKDVFIGAEIEGESGYINLMRMKSKYFDKIFKLLQKEIDKRTEEFPEFKEELYDKLYSFFKRYFSESGSIYYRRTPFNERIYEKVYTDNKDVIMFWKTHMLYYVKTDIQPKSMEVEIDGVKFFFDISMLEHKKANEKRELIYELKEVKNSTIVFNVLYSEKGRKTKINEILRELKKKAINLDEEILEKAFRIFEKQNEVDYFINKNARQFLKEQFDLWLYQYVYSDETQFTEKRIKQLKVLKEIAYKIIDFIAQFEDELVKIWQKPKFVLKSNYVITFDRIVKKEGGIKVIEKIIERLVEQKNEFERDLDKWEEIREKNKSYRTRLEEAGELKNQVVEWYLLDLVDDDFNPKEILIKGLNSEYQFLPIDTKYFKDLEIEILSLFDKLDQELDGWLIKSENWQALNTILPKFKEKVQTIYIDPPFNTGSNEFTMYINRFLDSAWITMIENRLSLAKDFLKDTGSIFVRIDYHGSHYVRFLMDDIFGKENFRNEIVVAKSPKITEKITRYHSEHDEIFLYSKTQNMLFEPAKVKRVERRWRSMHLPGERWSPIPEEYVSLFSPENVIEKNGKYYTRARIILGKEYLPPDGRHWALTQEAIFELEKKGFIRINNRGEPEALESEYKKLTDIWTDIRGYSQSWDFPTENSEILLKRVIESTYNKGELIMDFFLGSGTTTAVAHKLKRKWIGVEMGEHFYTVVLPRMKKVLAYDKSGISKDYEVKENYSKKKAGGFFKYYELEQYEDTLRRTKYSDADPLFDPTQDLYSRYIFLKDLKFLEALEIDYKNNKVKVNLEKLYKNIDIAETLSNLYGKWIKRIGEKYVEFEDGEIINIENLDYKIIRPLIWW